MRPALPILALCALGCSAIINPDSDRLGSDPPDSSVRLMDGGGADASDRDDAGTDAGMECPPSCDDGVACTDDRCEAFRCVNVPNDSACPGGERCNPLMGCVPERCSSDAECNDGLFCTGAERCDAGAPGSGCVAGTPVTCADDLPCTNDVCDEDRDACVQIPDPAVCNTLFCVVERTCDLTVGCGGGMPRSCSDGDPCTVESCDEGERRCERADLDADRDGFAAASVSMPGAPVVICARGTDCDDGDPDINPGETELCNGVDDNCNGMTDEGCATMPDTCATAMAIALGAAGTGTARGRFSDFTDDYQTSSICGAQPGGRDAVYYIDLPAGLHDVTIDTIGSAADTVLAVGLTCGMSGFQAVCDDDFDRRAGTDSRIFLHRVGSSAAATRVFILVDGYRSTTSADFTVNVTRRAAATDGCLSLGTTPAMDISGGGSVLGFSDGFIGGQRGSCQPFGDTDPEAIFRFTGPVTRTVDFDVFSLDFEPDIYIRSGACTRSEVACDVGAALGGGFYGAFLREGVTSGSQYYLFVDGGRGAYVVYFNPS